ncbi:multidrug efflux pump [Natronospira proteinivora]|uniref:Efflux pump membrane transporter n=1 Tax=Natronospira proteinivora TaxID=1807133 RepID=A0ABT1G6H1_9GAMM|nr:multidrug efflux RND transporter permease subunit [Natronospira proteinivora]MCP1726899.1 multidrug efflux pump [Natronospira proteinivora]
MLRFFVDRPVFASVISIIIVIAGLAALRELPVQQYPDILPPQVTVSASYPGANAETIADTVAAPIEAAVDGVDGMVYMQSQSTDDGSMDLVITFEVGTDPDLAAINVSNEVDSAMGRLPDAVRDQGLGIEKRSPSMLQMITFSSPDGSLDPEFISDYVWRNVYTEIRRSPGVGDQTFFGARIYSMRIWLEPDAMAEYDILPSDIAAAVEEQNAQYAAGAFGSEPADPSIDFTYSVITPDRLSEPAEFERIILRSQPDGSALRLGDVGRVELGAQNYHFRAEQNGQETVPVGIYLQPGANAVETATGIAQRLDDISHQFPEGLEYDIPFDTTVFIEASLNRVFTTLLIAVILVVLVVYLFLQKLRATFIPIIAVPISLIGTLVGMYLLGFSLNMLTLFGLVLAIGIVVDNAIIVLENTARIMREKACSPRDAVLDTLDEVAGPILAMTLVTIAVFLPVAFIGGFSGQMYQQFAITISVSMAISGVVALTLSPALCARLLDAQPKEPARPFQWFNTSFERLTHAYVGGVNYFLNHWLQGLAIFLLMIVAIIVLFRIAPGGLVPEEDQGYLYASAELPPASSLSRTQESMAKLSSIIQAYPEVENAVAFSGRSLDAGGSQSYSGTAYVTLSHWDERSGRGQSSDAVMRRLQEDGLDVTEASISAFNPPPISGISTTGGFTAYLQSRQGDDVSTLLAVTEDVIEAANERPELSNVRTTLSTEVPRYEADVDRELAWALDVPLSDIFDVMRSTFGQVYINDFNMGGRAMRVHMQAEAEYRQRPEDLDRIYVRSRSGNLVPISTLVSIEASQGADLVERFNVFPAARIMGDPAEGYSSAQAIAALEAVADDELSDAYLLSWTGAAYQEREMSGAATLAFVLGVVMVLLILAAQYERWTLPFAVMTVVPFAVFGALVAIWLTGLENNIYFQIGLLVLVSLAAKNAILIVEFALQQQKTGMGYREAALEAARLRFRPIIMTAISLILGSLPLALATGAGANSQHSIGVGIIGGMLSATFLAVLFVPMFYYLIMSGVDKLSGKTTTSEAV